MLEISLTDPESLRNVIESPLGFITAQFAAMLEQRRYSPKTLRVKVRQIHFLSGWMRKRHLGVQDLDEGLVREYVMVRRRAAPARQGERRTFRQLLELLRRGGHLRRFPECGGPELQQVVLKEFEQFLLEERGLSTITATRYRGYAGAFLKAHCEPVESGLECIQLSDLTAFLLQVRRCTPGQIQFVTSGIRAFLRFLRGSGRIPVDLAVGLPRVMSWRLANLPQRLSAEEVGRLLQAPDRGTAVGKRDSALLLILARLGLRASEVCGLLLEDVDWQAGALFVRGKGRREDWLPLAVDVGEALARYLREARPQMSSRHLFLTAMPPHEPVTRRLLSNIVSRWLKVSGLRPRGGAHLLRHSLASGLLAQGASLPEVGQVLRHRSAGTTEIYAKVHVRALRELAFPWPGAGGVAHESHG